MRRVLTSFSYRIALKLFTCGFVQAFPSEYRQ